MTEHPGRSGSVSPHLSENRNRSSIGFETESEGFDKTGINVVIDALKKVCEKMQR